VYSDRPHLCPIHPNAFITGLWNASGSDSKTCERVNQRLLNAFKIRAYVAPPFSQIKDRIAHDLTGTMIRHISTAVCLEELDTCARQDLLACEHVLRFCIAANSDDVRMLDEEKRINSFTLLPLLNEALLDTECLRVE